MTVAALAAELPGAYSIYAKNLITGRTIQYREHETMPSASLIKVPIMAEIFRRVEEEHLNLDDTLVMRQEDQVPGSGVLMDLTPGLTLSIRDLTTLMITISDNTATNLLIDFAGVDAVNALIRRLGLHHTVLERRLERIPVIRDQVNRTTAYDMSRLMELLATGQLISVDVSRRMIDILSRCQGPVSIAPPVPDTPFVGGLPAMKIAHKTGSLDRARHDSGVIYTARHTLVSTIMSQGAPADRLLPSLGRLGRAVLKELRSDS